MKIDLEKLRKEKKLQSVEIVEGKKYLAFLSVDSGITPNDMEHIPSIPNIQWIMVQGNPDDVVSIYEVK